MARKNNSSEKKMVYYAHTRGTDKTNWQSIQEHLNGAARIAIELGSDSGLAQFAYPAALLHDLGKYSAAFQKRLEGTGGKVDHSTAGAKEAARIFSDSPLRKILGEILAYCIAGHHGGLPDYGSPTDLEGGTLKARLKRKLHDYSAYSCEINAAEINLPERLPIRFDHETAGFSLSFFTRMLYSILVDADFLDTETFCSGEVKPRGGYAGLPELADTYTAFLKRFDRPTNEINRRRTQTLTRCIEQGGLPQGLFTLTLPTGAGKTFASMGFALQHARHHSLSRIIYVIPYTSIIEQNAAVFKESLGSYDDHVLEHHSNFDWTPGKRENGEDDGASALAKLRLAAENWDIPIVVTTSVQFFESIYANRSSRSRKVHNLAKSVILFDEAQMLPRGYLKPCLYAVAELVKNYGASAVFCTATQPCIEPFLPGEVKPTELIQNPQEQFDFYRRVQVVKQGKLSDAQLLERINRHPQALCIVNTRKHARSLFLGLEGEARCHLSTLMCPAHRSEVIAEIRSRLAAGLPCRVVSTQLLEAGVDLDFPVGFRALAGLESIIQSAGRVNREGKQESAELYVFEPDSEHARRMPAYIRQSAQVARMILNRFEDPVCIEAVQAYFKEIYGLQDQSAFDIKSILACFEKGTRNPDFDFQTAAERFRLIEENTVPVIIPYTENAAMLVENLRWTEFPRSIARKLQPFTVSIYEQEYQALLDEGVIDLYCERFAVLNDKAYYDEQVGLVLPERSGGQAVFIDF